MAQVLTCVDFIAQAAGGTRVWFPPSRPPAFWQWDSQQMAGIPSKPLTGNLRANAGKLLGRAAARRRNSQWAARIPSKSRVFWEISPESGSPQTSWPASTLSAPAGGAGSNPAAPQPGSEQHGFQRSGYLRPFPIERSRRDLWVHRIHEQINEILRLIVGADLLT